MRELTVIILGSIVIGMQISLSTMAVFPVEIFTIPVNAVAVAIYSRKFYRRCKK